MSSKTSFLFLVYLFIYLAFPFNILKAIRNYEDKPWKPVSGEQAAKLMFCLESFPKVSLRRCSRKTQLGWNVLWKCPRAKSWVIFMYFKMILFFTIDFHFTVTELLHLSFFSESMVWLAEMSVVFLVNSGCSFFKRIFPLTDRL